MKTGKLVWNQNKEALTHSATGAIPLIWSHNITLEGIALSNKVERPQFVKTQKSEEGPVIVTNRIIGQPGRGSLRPAFIPAKFQFIAENHVNVIYPPNRNSLLRTKNADAMFEALVKQLNSSANAEILFSLTGNTQISKNELENLFPIKLA